MYIAADKFFDGNKFSGSGRIAVREGKILTVESGPETGAALVAPGFIDSHLHLLNLGLGLQGLRLNQCGSLAEFSRALTDYARENTSPWLTGRGWDQNKLGFTPDRWLLDALCPERPVVLTRTCGHVVAANSKALELTGITEDMTIPGGVIRRDYSGRVSGVLEENATRPLLAAIPEPDGPTLYSALASGIKYAHGCGITGVHSDDRRLVQDYSALWDLYQRVTDSHPLRVQLHYSVTCLADLQEFIRIAPELEDTSLLHKGAAKIFLDGSLGAGTAALLADYDDQPGQRGVLVYEDAALGQIVKTAEEHGVLLAVHAIGDGAVEQFLRILARVRRGENPGQTQHRLIHLQVTNPSQLKRVKAMNLAVEIQPVFLRTDMHWAEKRLGHIRLQDSYCWRSMDQLGLFLSGGSDAPVEDANPWLGIATAVTRRDECGRYAAAWKQDESLGLERALSLFTQAPAALAHWPGLGRIAPGAWADLAIYSRFSEDLLAENGPEQVLVQGEIVYRR